MDKCLICGRKLTDDGSKNRGFGSTCWRRLQVVIKEEQEKRKLQSAIKRRKAHEAKGQVSIFEE